MIEICEIGRKKNEILPGALEKSLEPDVAPKQAIRRSQRKKNNKNLESILYKIFFYKYQMFY